MTAVHNIHPSDQTIVLLARQIHVIYDERDSTEIVGLYIQDERLGEVLLPLTLNSAAAVIGDIAKMLANIDALRAQLAEQREAAGDD